MATSKDTVAYVLEQLEPLDVRAMRTRHLAAAQKPSAMCGQDAGGIRRGAARVTQLRSRANPQRSCGTLHIARIVVHVEGQSSAAAPAGASDALDCPSTCTTMRAMWSVPHER